MSKFLPVLRTAGRFLTFRASREELLQLDYRHLIFGLLSTWLVGIGRAWDYAQADALQRWGAGSVAYVFVMALILWASIRPLTMESVTYRQILTFVCLTSPPGLIYAIPVEMFLSPSAARTTNEIFLAIVATWRVGLLFFYLSRVMRFSWQEAVVAALTPLAVIMALLSPLGFVGLVFAGMAGVRHGPGDNESSGKIIAIIAFLGFVALIAVGPLVAAHNNLSTVIARKKSYRELDPDSDETEESSRDTKTYSWREM